MKVSLVLLAIFATAFAASIEHTHNVPKDVLEKEKAIISLLYHINQVSIVPEHVKIAQTYNPMQHVEDFTDPEVVKNYTIIYENGLLSRDHVFSIYYHDHLEEAIALFDLFYHAKTWDTFYKTAVWARQHVNQGVFVYALYVNVVHHPKMVDVVLPPIYEVMPHYFFNNDVIHKAYEYKMVHDTVRVENHQENHWHTIDSNYSGHYLNLHPEQYMSYWMEDVEINAQNFYYHINFPFWMKSSEYGLKNSRRGEIFLVVLQNIVGRYYLERLSNDFGEIPHIDFDGDIETPYVPSLVYPNGLEFPERPIHAKINHKYSQKHTHVMPVCTKYRLQDWERRVSDAIDVGKVYDQEQDKMVSLYKHHEHHDAEIHEVVGNMIEGNADSPSVRYYGRVMECARRLFGYSLMAFDHHHVVPSALEHEETAMRDPVYYQILKKLLLKYRRFTMHLPPYTKEELIMPGVEIKKVEIDDLITYDDWSMFDLTNAVHYSEKELHGDFQVRARQSRLNHKPFHVNIHVHSEKDQQAAVRIYMAPKYDEYGRHINVSENVLHMISVHHFKHELKTGDNVITVNSQNVITSQPDRMGYFTMYKSLSSAIEEKSEFHVDDRQNEFLWPQRYLLPKGRHDGFPVQFFVYVYPVHHVEHVERPSQREEIYVDETPLLYPFDRMIEHEHMFLSLPNAHWHVQNVYHKDVQDINSPHHH